MLSEKEQADLHRFIAAIYGFGRILSRRQRAQIDRCYEVMLKVYIEHERQHRFDKNFAAAAEQLNLGAMAALRASV